MPSFSYSGPAAQAVATPPPVAPAGDAAEPVAPAAPGGAAATEAAPPADSGAPAGAAAPGEGVLPAGQFDKTPQPMKAGGRKRARGQGGAFRGDDPATPENEAWE